MNSYCPEQDLIKVADVESLLPMLENVKPDIVVCFYSYQEAAFLVADSGPVQGRCINMETARAGRNSSCGERSPSWPYDLCCATRHTS